MLSRWGILSCLIGMSTSAFCISTDAHAIDKKWKDRTSCFTSGRIELGILQCVMRGALSLLANDALYNLPWRPPCIFYLLKFGVTIEKSSLNMAAFSHVPLSTGRITLTTSKLRETEVSYCSMIEIPMAVDRPIQN